MITLNEHAELMVARVGLATGIGYDRAREILVWVAGFDKALEGGNRTLAERQAFYGRVVGVTWCLKTLGASSIAVDDALKAIAKCIT